MRDRVYRLHSQSNPWRYIGPEALLAVVLALIMLVAPAGAAPMRFQDRSLYMNSTAPGATTYYKVAFSYMSPLPVGSVDLLFCIDPIPHHACVAPEGLDVSGAVLSEQTGETGFSVSVRANNHLVLSRTPSSIPVHNESSYTFDNIVNPTDTTQSFSVRLRSHSTNNATGPQIDFGSLKGQVTDGIIIETQVPPMLIFCLAEEVAEDCSETNQTHYRDMGQLSADGPLAAQSQMAVGTNATAGFSIIVYGTPMSAGIHPIESLSEPTESTPGTNQFGINLVANDEPNVGSDPEGPWANAVVADGYNEPNKFKYVSGDQVAYSPNVSLMRKYTVSYMVNANPNLRAGVYSTTLTYIASGRF